MKQSHRHFALRTSARLLLSAIATASFSVSLHAEEALETMTVTANRMPSVNVLAPSTVITRADIERLQITDLPSLLSRQPGIDVAVNGGLGKASSLYTRGTNSGHTLIMVDGVKWHSATLGTTSIQDFPVEQIERIEIVRGPRSGLYGSEAIGGVIHIFTRKGQQGVTPYAKISYGTHNSKSIAAGVNGGDEHTTYNLSFSRQSTNGIDSSSQLGQNEDDDGYTNKNLSAKINHKINDDWSIGANVTRVDARNEIDRGSLTDDYKSDSIQQVLGVNSSLQVYDFWTIDMQLSESRDQSKNLKNDLPDGVFNTRHRFANISNIIKLSDNHVLNLGLDYEVDDIVSSREFSKTSRDNKALFISWQGNSNRHDWLLSARHDNNEAFGSSNTGFAEWGYELKNNLQVTTSIGTAFKAPTFNDLYYPFIPPVTYGSVTYAGYSGNQSLVPEESRSVEFGLNGTQDWGEWAISIYETKIDDLISYAVDGTSNIGMMTNVNKANIKGVEFNVSTIFMGADIALNTSFLKPEDEETGKILSRRAQRLANVNIDKQWGAWASGASWKLRGHSFDDVANTTRLGGFGLLDLRIAYDLNQDWSVKANLSNAFNKEYQTINNYNSLDRTVMFTLSYQP